MKEVVFIKSYANKKKNDKGVYDGILCNTLVRILKVAKYSTKKSK